MRRSTVLLVIALVVLLGAAIVSAVNQSAPTGPATQTTVPPFDCVAVSLDVQTGVQTETPAPCLTGEGGCSTSISYRIEEDGSVVVWCGWEVTQ